MARPDWGSVLRATSSRCCRCADCGRGLALLGTTLTSYVYIWETIGRGVEEQPDRTRRGLARARAGAVTGAVSTAVILWFMLITSPPPWAAHHVTVSSAAQVAAGAHAAGRAGAADLFAVGLLPRRWSPCRS